MPVRSCERVVISDRNALAWVVTPSGRLLAKWSVVREHFPRLGELARLTHWLAARGLPVSAPVPTTDGRLQVELDAASMGLQRVVGADLLDTTDADRVHAAGAVLARVQEALAEYPDTDRITTLAGPRAPLPDRITQWLDSAAAHVPARARDTLRRLVADAPTEALPHQLLHGDFRAANILCAGTEVAAVIDFEEATCDHRVVELARSTVLLGTRFHDWGPVSPDVHTHFRSGYESARPLTTAEAGWWDALVLWHTLAMVRPGDDPTGWRASAMRHVAELTARA